jgi:predicted dehydrogenase
MIRVGILGIGFMGMIHYLAYQQVSGVQVSAIVSRSEKKLAGDWRGIKGNFGPEGGVVNLSSIARYKTVEQLLGDNGIDLVDICLPPSLHADACIRALRAGKHVFCEKPISLEIADADRMVEAAKQTNRRLMIGQVLPFFPEYDFVRKHSEQKTYGGLIGGCFKRIISDPTWLSDYYDPQTSGGPLIDLHIHDAHFIRLLFGMPEKVFSRGRLRGEVVEFAVTQFIFPSDESLLVAATSGVIAQQGRTFNQAFEVYFEDATLFYDFYNLAENPHTATPLTVLSSEGSVEQPELGSTDPLDAFIDELQEVAFTVERGEPSLLLDGVLARDALLICHRQSESVRTGQVVKI